MSPDVSRALGQARHALGLGAAAAADMRAEFGSAASVEELPAWIRRLTEFGEGSEGAAGERRA